MNDEFCAAVVADPEHMLEHYGVLGMKWGIRRYQNPDGTLTALGKKHMEDGKTQKVIDKFNEKKQTAIAKGDSKFIDKHMDYMTNEDLNKFSERLRTKNSYEKMKSDAMNVDSEKIRTWMNTASNIVQSAANMTENGIKIYNAVAKINNATSSGKKMKLIGEDQSKRPETIKNVYDEDGKLKTQARTYTDAKGNTVTDTKTFGSKKDDKGSDDSASKSSGSDKTPPTSPSSGGSSNFTSDRANAWKNAFKNTTEHYTGTVEGVGNSSKKSSSETKSSSKKDSSPIDVKWKDVTEKTPSTALTIYSNYRSSASNSDSSSNSSSGGFKGFKNNWTESAAKGYKDVDDYTDELLKRRQ